MRAEEEHLDLSTALRQFLHVGAEEYILELIVQGRITIGKASELMNKTVYDVQRIAQKHGVKIGATAEQIHKSRNTAKQVLR